MANFHMSIKVGSASKGGAAGHGDYIRRDEKVKVREDHPVDVVTQNLPEWANSANEFWLAADKFERKNGSSYREFECSLPVELSNAENIRLATEWAKKEFPNQFVEIALHWKAGNPHAHIQVCERIADTKKSSAEHYFKRPASNYRNRAGEMCAPSAVKVAEGGCKKSDRFTRNDLKQLEGENRLKYLKRVKSARKFAIREIRQSFADMTNQFLDKNGFAERVSSLSYEARGIDKPAGIHISQKACGLLKRNVKVDIAKQLVEDMKRQNIIVEKNVAEKAQREALAKHKIVTVTKSAFNKYEVLSGNQLTCQYYDSLPCGVLPITRVHKAGYARGAWFIAGYDGLVAIEKSDGGISIPKPSVLRDEHIAELIKSVAKNNEIVITGNDEFKSRAARIAESLNIKHNCNSVTVTNLANKAPPSHNNSEYHSRYNNENRKSYTPRM